MSAGVHQWTTERLHGPVSDLLGAAEPSKSATRLVRIHTITRPALVLGSTQSLDAADPRRAADAGAEVVRRRSGGGAVLLQPGGQIWADFFVPAADPLWSDDVARAVHWVGELWSTVIEPFVTEPISVHSGRLEADDWGRLVCFAGRGSGEVFVGGLKVVGISQRRSRQRARIQTTARLRHPPTAESGHGPERAQIGGGPSRRSGVIPAPVGRAHGPPKPRLHSPRPRANGPDSLTYSLDLLDELALLDVAPQDRNTGREVMAARCGAIGAIEADVIAALLRTLKAGA